ncbi:hypothetical protein ACVW1C_003783 [Bradyrhizobium sp. USDA 4011]
MLHDRRQRHREWLRQLAHRQAFPLAEPRQKRAAGGVGKRSKGAVQRLVLILNHTVWYRRNRQDVKRPASRSRQCRGATTPDSWDDRGRRAEAPSQPAATADGADADDGAAEAAPAGAARETGRADFLRKQENVRTRSQGTDRRSGRRIRRDSRGSGPVRTTGNHRDRRTRDRCWPHRQPSSLPTPALPIVIRA